MHALVVEAENGELLSVILDLHDDRCKQGPRLHHGMVCFGQLHEDVRLHTFSSRHMRGQGADRGGWNGLAFAYRMTPNARRRRLKCLHAVCDRVCLQLDRRKSRNSLPLYRGVPKIFLPNCQTAEKIMHRARYEGRGFETETRPATFAPPQYEGRVFETGTRHVRFSVARAAFSAAAVAVVHITSAWTAPRPFSPWQASRRPHPPLPPLS